MFKICQEIQEFFFNDCLGKIEYCLNTISTSDNNTTSISDIQIICKDYKDSFDFMSSHGASQNKEKKNFTKSGQYVASQSYVIGHSIEQLLIS